MANNELRTAQELLDEFTEDVSLNEFNLSEKRFLAPTFVPKWIGIRMEYRRYLKKKEKELEKLRDTEQILIRQNLKVDIPEDQIKKLKLKKHKEIEELENDIYELKETLDALDRLVNAISFYRNDIRNAIDYSKLEHGC
jgi:hypothetical protein